jgi:hypothetical protein
LITPNIWSECTKVCTLSTFTSVHYIFGFAHLGSSCVSSSPFLEPHLPFRSTRFRGVFPISQC